MIQQNNGNKKYKYDLSMLSEVKIYDLVYSKRIKRFPPHFWDNPDVHSYAPLITRHLIEDILKWDDNEIKKNLRKETFSDNGLAGMLSIVYNSSPYKAITLAYPEKNYKAWDFVNAPNYYWQGEEGKKNGYNAMKWLIEEHLHWDYDDIKEKFNHKVLTDNNLLGMFKKVYSSNLFNAINSLYPNIFKPWELGDHVANNYWNIEKGKEAVKWLVEDKLKWDEETLKKNLCKEIFKENNLYGMIQRCFNSSPVTAIIATYPGKFHVWEFPNVPVNYWTFETACEATKWLIENKLRWSKNDIITNYSRETFINNGFITIVDKFNIYEIINNIYPNEFKEWEFNTLPSSFWTIEMSKKAMKWVIEEKLGWDKNYALKHLKQHHLSKYRIGYMTRKNQISIQELIELAYKEK